MMMMIMMMIDDDDLNVTVGLQAVSYLDVRGASYQHVLQLFSILILF